jgi:hypothetical protein
MSIQKIGLTMQGSMTHQNSYKRWENYSVKILPSVLTCRKMEGHVQPGCEDRLLEMMEEPPDTDYRHHCKLKDLSCLNKISH